MANPYNSYPSGQTPTNDAPLPPLPSKGTQYSVSPVGSPFTDPYLSSGALGHDIYSNTAYSNYSSSAQLNRLDSNQRPSQDPFRDSSAIPLQNQGKMENGMRQASDSEMYGAGVEKRPSQKKNGWFSGRITWVVYVLTAVQIGVFVGELIKNGILTGSPIQTKPNFNIMIGPSPYVLINMGARFTPCMHNIQSVIDAKVLDWPCPNATAIGIGSPTCPLSTLCGNGGVPDQTGVIDWRNRSKEPNQWWRFITPIFLHAGLIHIGFNMLLQLTLGRDMEKEIGSLRFTLVYFSAGIFGFVLGGNYAPDGITSVGASGALFGILALTLLDLFYNWSSRPSPVKDLFYLLLDIVVTFVLGLLPGLDNFAHIGGFLMGLILGICLLHSPQALRRRIGLNEPPYSSIANPAAGPSQITNFAKQPVGFFKGRKPLWWAWWLVRVGGLVAAFIGFILLLKNFYEWRNTCSWCRHLSCLPITSNGVDWCNIGRLNFQTNNGTSKRGLSPIDAMQFSAQAMGFVQ